MFILSFIKEIKTMRTVVVLHVSLIMKSTDRKDWKLKFGYHLGSSVDIEVMSLES